MCLILEAQAGTVKQLVLEEALMSAQALEAPRFIRKTQLAPNEYRKNFHQLDNDIIQAITSPEADRITPLMSKIYLRLTTAPTQYWERDGVLRFEAEWREGKHVKAWSALCGVLGVASATASKALAWMHDVGVIGYFSGKNGVGIRIFINRASSSIGRRAPQAGQKILSLVPASSGRSHTSTNEAAFNDSFAVKEISETDVYSRAPKNGANQSEVGKIAPNSDQDAPNLNVEPAGGRPQTPTATVGAVFQTEGLVRQILSELEPRLRSAALQAARQEHERTREWLEKRGLPKAARVAQHEAYNVLKNHGLVNDVARRTRAELEVGRGRSEVEVKPLSDPEIKELAQVCVALLDTQGQSIEVTLSEISSEAGGCLLPIDVPRVRVLAEQLARENSRKEIDV